ncbi:hypothetical protein VARIO8X_90387 [Burkholderiales bacterium 8X]|nr:hypothetical protein VARIO8X_90387 [Burkholderiales bacterium 8X]
MVKPRRGLHIRRHHEARIASPGVAIGIAIHSGSESMFYVLFLDGQTKVLKFKAWFPRFEIDSKPPPDHLEITGRFITAPGLGPLATHAEFLADLQAVAKYQVAEGLDFSLRMLLAHWRLDAPQRLKREHAIDRALARFYGPALQTGYAECDSLVQDLRRVLKIVPDASLIEEAKDCCVRINFRMYDIYRSTVGRAMPASDWRSEGLLHFHEALHRDRAEVDPALLGKLTPVLFAIADRPTFMHITGWLLRWWPDRMTTPLLALLLETPLQEPRIHSYHGSLGECLAACSELTEPALWEARAENFFEIRDWINATIVARTIMHTQHALHDMSVDMGAALKPSLDVQIEILQTQRVVDGELLHRARLRYIRLTLARPDRVIPRSPRRVRRQDAYDRELESHLSWALCRWFEWLQAPLIHTQVELANIAKLAPPHPQLSEDQVRWVLHEACHATVESFAEELDDLLKVADRLGPTNAREAAKTAVLDLESLRTIAEVPSPSVARFVCIHASQVITDLRSEIKRQPRLPPPPMLLVECIRALTGLFATATMTMDRARRSLLLLPRVRPIDHWAFLEQELHLRFIPHVRRIEEAGRSRLLSWDEALALHVDGSRDGEGFIISVHLWRHVSGSWTSPVRAGTPFMNPVGWFDTRVSCHEIELREE